jgi:hypothetical protein
MRPKDSHYGQTPAALEAQLLGFLGLGIVARASVFCLRPTSQVLTATRP